MSAEGSNEDRQLASLSAFCGGAPVRLEEGGRHFIVLPSLRVPGGRVCDALLEPIHDNPTYPTKLYLKEKFEPISKPKLNWNGEVYADAATWHSWSWKDVSRNQALPAILAAHLEAFH